MNFRARTYLLRVFFVLGLTQLLHVQAASAQWAQWGGPSRNFAVEASGLADRWPDDGPKKIWHRKLGDGYSAIVYDDGVLYTMYRKKWTSEHEYTIALDAKTGQTIWEHGNKTPLIKAEEGGWGGEGPNSTPLVAGGRVFSIGLRGVMHCFDKKSGEVAWRRDLAVELGGRPTNAAVGYSCSPIAYKNAVITTSGRDWVFDREDPGAEAGGQVESAAKGNGNTLIALDQATGEVLWRTLDDPADCSSPVLIRFGGRDQLLVQTRTGLVGVDPSNGELLWRQSWSRENAFTTPIWNDDGLVFCTTGMDNPGRVLRLLDRNGVFSAEEVWSSSKIKCVVSTPVRVGDHLVGGTGANPGFLVAVNMQTGEVSSKKRGYDIPSIVRAGEKLIILTQEGQLSLATLDSGDLTIQSSCKIAEQYSLSVPTLVQTKLYVRDRKHIMALDLAR